MSNLEHLIENGLSALKRGVSYEKWLKIMKDDVNWQDNENIFIEQLWTICQYVIYTWIPSAESELIKCKDCKYYYNTNPENIPTANIICFQMHEDDYCSYAERRTDERFYQTNKRK